MQELKCDHCLKCAEPTEHGYVFCEKCTPRYGQTTRIFSDELQKELALYVGTFPTGSVIKDRFRGRLRKMVAGNGCVNDVVQSSWQTVDSGDTAPYQDVIARAFTYQHWFTGPRLIASLQRGRFLTQKNAHKGVNVFSIIRKTRANLKDGCTASK
ncbi:MAG: hypothetical protein E2O79_00805 [Caldithrix sp.]|nr:MAG: hypothetical protein E2O79_00805 [Caldithrix sp.]